MVKQPKQMTDAELNNEMNTLRAIKAWGARLAELEEERGRRYAREMTKWVGSPAADCYYQRGNDDKAGSDGGSKEAQASR